MDSQVALNRWTAGQGYGREMIGKSGLRRLRFSHVSEHMVVGKKCKYILCLLTLIRQNYLVSKHELVSLIGYQSVSTMGYELAGQMAEVEAMHTTY